MANYDCFLKSNSLEGLTQAIYDGRSVLEEFDKVEAAYRRYSHSNEPFLFAKPFISAARDGKGQVVSWYTDAHGPAIRFVDLDATTQNHLKEQITKQLHQLSVLFDDKDVGPIIQRWLNIADISRDLFFVANRPVLTNWGLLPDAVLHDKNVRLAHAAKGLSGLLGNIGLPPFQQDDHELASKWAGGSFMEKNEIDNRPPEIGDSLSENIGSGAKSDKHLSAPNYLVPVIASGILLFLIALLLLVYLLPAGNIGLRATSDAKDETIALLEEKRTSLKNATDGFSCSIEGNASQQPSNGLNGPKPETPRSQSAIPRALLTPSAGPIDHAEKATVLVLVADDGSEEVSIGSGFFINQTDVVTNLHVIGQATQATIINKALGKAVSATLVAKSRADAQIGAPDFAVLRVQGISAPAVLTVGGATAKGENVIAAGFPGIVMETDLVYHRLLQGDMTAAPEMAVTQGMVTTFQSGIEGLDLILHTAAISGGNSGGPLIDYCGRAIGVNTFLRSGSMQNSPLSFAQRTNTLSAFLKGANIPFSFDAGACNPEQSRGSQNSAESNVEPAENSSSPPTDQTRQPDTGQSQPPGQVSGDHTTQPAQNHSVQPSSTPPTTVNPAHSETLPSPERPRGNTP
ncbi:trypsin-like peptidase domain-containing protein [Bartonella sp. LJL80]